MPSCIVSVAAEFRSTAGTRELLEVALAERASLRPLSESGDVPEEADIRLLCPKPGANANFEAKQVNVGCLVEEIHAHRIAQQA